MTINTIKAINVIPLNSLRKGSNSNVINYINCINYFCLVYINNNTIKAINDFLFSSIYNNTEQNLLIVLNNWRS